jgi:phycocyanin alpha chain
MNTTLTEVVARANDEERFLSNDELQVVSAWTRHATLSLQAAESLNAQARSLSKAAADQIYQRFPGYGESQYLKEKCIRDIEYFLRGITYCLAVGSTEPLDNYFLTGLEEVYRSFDLSPICAVEAILYLKAYHNLTEDEGLEANIYFDYLISYFLLSAGSFSVPKKSKISEKPQGLDEDSLIRGLVVVPHKPKILFETSLNLQADQLPRLRPQIIIDEPMTETSND